MKKKAIIPYWKVNSFGFSYEFMGIMFYYNPSMGFCYMETNENETTEVYFGNRLDLPNGVIFIEQDWEEESETYLDYTFTFIPR